MLVLDKLRMLVDFSEILSKVTVQRDLTQTMKSGSLLPQILGGCEWHAQETTKHCTNPHRNALASV